MIVFEPAYDSYIPNIEINGAVPVLIPLIYPDYKIDWALVKQKIPAKFIRYPGNYHGGWPAWDMVHRYHNEMEWFKEYLKP